MSDKRVTDLTRKIPISGEDLIHRVETGDTSQHPDGSSYKNTWADLENFVVNAADVIVGNAILKGGVVWLGGLDYLVWADKYIINNRVYSTSVSTEVTLNDGDPTNPRIDVFIIEVNAFQEPPVITVDVLEGTPAASPTKPTVDQTSQVEVTFKLVAATETTDPISTIDEIYNENAGTPSEWANDNTPSLGSLAASADPYDGSLYATIPATNSTGDYFEWSDSSTKNFSGSDRLIFALRFTGAFSDNTPGAIAIKLNEAAADPGYLHTINFTGLTASLGWVIYDIPLSDFQATGINATSVYDTIRFTFQNLPAAELDFIRIQSGLAQPAPIATQLRQSSAQQSGNGWVSVDLDAAQIKALGTTFPTIINGLDDETILFPEFVIAEFKGGSTGFTGNSVIIETEDAESVFIFSGTLISGTADVVRFATFNNNISLSAMTGKGYRVSGTDSVATGDGTLRIHVKFSTVPGYVGATSF